MKKRTVIFDMVTIILLCGLLSGCGQIRNAHPITDVHNLDGQRVGVGLAWGPDYLLTEREDLTLMRYNNVAGAVTALCYNQVDAIAVVTSDYHVRQSCAMFAAVSNYQSGYKGGKNLELVGNVVCDTGFEEDSLMTQAWGISLIMGIPFDEKAKAPELYHVDIPEEVYVAPAATEVMIADPEPENIAAVVEEPEHQPDPRERWIIPAGCVAAALVVLWIISPKKPKKRNRREKPKMNWDVE